MVVTTSPQGPSMSGGGAVRRWRSHRSSQYRLRNWKASSTATQISKASNIRPAARPISPARMSAGTIRSSARGMTLDLFGLADSDGETIAGTSHRLNETIVAEPFQRLAQSPDVNVH